MQARVLSVNPSAKTLGELFTPGGTRVYSCPRRIEKKKSYHTLLSEKTIALLSSSKLMRRLFSSLNNSGKREQELTYDLFRRM